ncbi:Peptidoglycan/LPS O-acetylase OafA/YrhL, contains acyltransferase and SGNH-hydrolase domains [Noviherbaspirillum humi]|uniref:Peptidoglycan/LPS O-acetylase OafA/YrhL, contains acyltransferase and SGNH-hydrolase domains n=1 Tax=Noviherbaspirillum humi TaxID=1688639 RepID=A0A239HLT8_9BURK|nr:acyltransferase family protein [Noviherbaspirillum humi]SNS81813.1 Peptidoglycan/LPS O-acetylase OafA/YrhL, contains acyltransferase and SGNH-hydrolase domains [Noviherbaspirillum humi]
MAFEIEENRVSRLPYRTDIDGLRAFAVISVILMHIDKSLLPGGFVGVDIFFVLSGFLITGLILKDLDCGRFSFVQFYCRRIKRIAPAALAVILVCATLAHFLMMPDDARETAKAAVWSVASLTNVYYSLFRDTGYFAPSSAELPLLHLWSLGVEEQFYLLWPLLLVVLYPHLKKSYFLLLLSLIALGSFFLGEILFPVYPSLVYFLLPTRAGELIVGALVYFAIHGKVEARFGSKGATPIAICGASLLTISVFMLNEGQVFPGLRAMVPTLGTGMLLFAGHLGENPVKRILCFKPLATLGLISYSAYLWHWPILAFYRYGYGQPGAVAGTIIFVLTIFLAYICYFYIERPARNVKNISYPLVFKWYLTASFSTFTIAILLVYPGTLINKIWTTNFEVISAKVLATEIPPTEYEYVCLRKTLTIVDASDGRCVIGDFRSARPPALLWGDSNAAHYVGMVGYFASHNNFTVRNLAAGTCPPILGDKLRQYVSRTREPHCLASQAVVIEALKATEVVIIGAAWNFYEEYGTDFLTDFFATVRQLTDAGKEVVIIGKIPEIDGFDRYCKVKALRYPLLYCNAVKSSVSKEVLNINERLKRFAEMNRKVHYFDPVRYICPNASCSTHLSDGIQLYFDRSHISIPGSWRLGEVIYATEGVPEAFRSAYAQKLHLSPVEP